ncbi:hypothetical protein R1sor_015104 [Riccia sorocarpa]|uniref:Uncharacterized protein n=1 Tax=Riccia sorocarpa TaxID=122646 RepID=A0ABD3HEI9_9MARC
MASSSSVNPDKFTNLVRLLPTGTFVAFSVLVPIITNDGNCHTLEKTVTGIVVGLFAFLCAFSTFTDSFVTSDGTICLTLLCTPLTDCYYAGVPSNVLKSIPIPVNFLVGLLFAFAPPARHGIGNGVRITGTVSDKSRQLLDTSTETPEI